MTVARGIEEAGYMRFGGVEQWVLMRGEDLDNPPLILLHGGPGFSETHFFRRHNAPLERDFTAVYWDQRGAGKSFSPGLARDIMTVERFIADLDELVEAVRRRVGRERVVLFGHSWGSALGVLYAARFPEKVAAYVGSGQIGDWPAGEAASYAYALREARRQENDRAVRELLAIGPPPHSATALWTQRMWLQRLGGPPMPRALLDLVGCFLRVPELSLADLPGLLRGFRFSLDAMWAEVSRLDLTAVAPALEMPVFFFLGRRDRWVPAETSAAYFEALSAPSKRLVWFEESGHEPFVDEAAKFNRLMVQLVRPVAD